MLFNSIDFAVFLPIVFVLYWLINGKNLKWQNLFLLAASYVFYGWWDWRFLFLILLSTAVDYGVGLGISRSRNRRHQKILLFTSLATNIGLLGFFKYYNFFITEFVTGFSFLGVEIGHSTLNIILPVGISFYTFQTLSYTIDVFRGKLEPTKSFIVFAAYVSFFPQLVAGPIERATQLLPQFNKQRSFNYSKAVDGVRQALWGLFKKVVVADNCAEYVNIIFGNSDEYSGATLLLGAFLFAIQIYGDFSGYSDIAIGVARLFGFNLMRNFAFPYFSRDIAEFWRRWHISLSTWFRDYLYIPLGGSRGSTVSNIRNVFIIFVVSGFWHGANWTFIFWGFLNALYFLPLLLLSKNRENVNVVAQGKALPSIRESFAMISTFLLTLLAWVFFRAENLDHAQQYLSVIFSASLFSIPEILPLSTLSIIGVLLITEWMGREGQHGIEKVISNKPLLVRWSFYTVVSLAIFISMGNQQEFIYFQF